MLIKLTAGRGAISLICLPNFLAQTRFLANGVWQMAHRFGKFQLTNRAQILLVKLNDKMFAKLCVPVTFCLANKVW